MSRFNAFTANQNLVAAARAAGYDVTRSDGPEMVSARVVTGLLGQSLDVRAFGAVGDGVTDDTAAIQAALTAGAGNAVFLPAGTYLITDTLSIPANTKLFGVGPQRSVIERGFNGTMITIALADAEVSDLALDGAAPAFTGKGIVVGGGTASLRPVFRNLWTISMGAVTDTHLEFGADAGQLAVVHACTFRLGGGDLDFRAIHTNGPDTGFAGRSFSQVSVGNGYISFAGAQDTLISLSAFARIEMDGDTSILSVTGCVWANLGVAMTLTGSIVTIMGCRFSGSITFAAAFRGCFIGNIQTDTSYTITNNSNNAGSVIVHSTLNSSSISLYETLQTRVSGSGSAGFNLPHGSAPSSPVNGDMWTTTAGLYVRINGVTVGPLS